MPIFKLSTGHGCVLMVFQLTTILFVVRLALSRCTLLPISIDKKIAVRIVFLPETRHAIVLLLRPRCRYLRWGWGAIAWSGAWCLSGTIQSHCIGENLRHVEVGYIVYVYLMRTQKSLELWVPERMAIMIVLHDGQDRGLGRYLSYSSRGLQCLMAHGGTRVFISLSTFSW